MKAVEIRITDGDLEIRVRKNFASRSKAALEDFIKVHGVGPSKYYEGWLERKNKHEDLKKRQAKLSK